MNFVTWEFNCIHSLFTCLSIQIRTSSAEKWNRADASIHPPRFDCCTTSSYERIQMECRHCPVFRNGTCNCSRPTCSLTNANQLRTSISRNHGRVQHLLIQRTVKLFLRLQIAFFALSMVVILAPGTCSWINNWWPASAKLVRIPGERNNVFHDLETHRTLCIFNSE